MFARAPHAAWPLATGSSPAPYPRDRAGATVPNPRLRQPGLANRRPRASLPPAAHLLRPTMRRPPTREAATPSTSCVSARSPNPGRGPPLRPPDRPEAHDTLRPRPISAGERPELRLPSPMAPLANGRLARAPAAPRPYPPATGAPPRPSAPPLPYKRVKLAVSATLCHLPHLRLCFSTALPLGSRGAHTSAPPRTPTNSPPASPPLRARLRAARGLPDVASVPERHLHRHPPSFVAAAAF
uniref:Uncharacterized protein n=1 Tax=Setaria viridis TaxID=4556 RepID=A0A4U6V1E6_SETVI|nr:LOW QUALITY PROTEIN: hypothetical protein SEVIR_4G129400v2 [Setaria viridis]